MKIISLIAVGLIMLTGVVSCKTSEANYKRAYETAKSGNAGDELDAEVYAQMYREAAPDTVEVDGVVFPAKFAYLSTTTTQGIQTGQVERFNVAAATFRQLFNARDMVQKLRRDGYIHAFVAEDRDENYYVIAGSFLNANDAEHMLHQLIFANHVSISKPFPYVIIRP